MYGVWTQVHLSPQDPPLMQTHTRAAHQMLIIQLLKHCFTSNDLKNSCLATYNIYLECSVKLYRIYYTCSA